jgi:6-phosphofructokinase 1
VRRSEKVKSNYMVGLRNDTISLTPLEQAIKGRRKLIESCLESDIMST